MISGKERGLLTTDRHVVGSQLEREDRKVAAAWTMETTHAKQYLSLTRVRGYKRAHS